MCVAPGKRAPTDRMEARADAVPMGALAAPAVPAQHANHVEDPARDPLAPGGLFANDDPFGFHLLGKKRVTTGVNVRSAPKVAPDNRVGGYDRDHVVNVIARDGEWALVMHDGRPAYVHGKYLENVPSANAAAAAAPKPAGSAPANAADAAAKPANADRQIAAEQPVVDHSFDKVIEMARASGPQASALANDLIAAAALQKSAPIGKRGGREGNVGFNEEQGPKRADLVRAIARLRDGIEALPAELMPLKGALYRAVQDLAPY
jgi:hypothetical protein